MEKDEYRITDILVIFLGTNLYAFGLVMFNIANNLAEGGVTGITLILFNLFGIDPAYSTLLINIPLILIGAKILGRRSFVYTTFGTISLSVCLWVWQRVPLTINLDHDLLIAALLAGLGAGLGSGFIYRVGGTTGGMDIISRILEKKAGISMGRSLLALDVMVLIASLCYLDLKHMMYTMIVSFVFSNVVDFVQDGAYTAKGVLVVSNHSTKIAEAIFADLERGVSFFKGQGGYSKEEKLILYCVVNPREIAEVKRIITEIDSNAFISVINVHEALGEGFTYDRPAPKSLLRKRVR